MKSSNDQTVFGSIMKSKQVASSLSKVGHLSLAIGGIWAIFIVAQKIWSRLSRKDRNSDYDEGLEHRVNQLHPEADHLVRLESDKNFESKGCDISSLSLPIPEISLSDEEPVYIRRTDPIDTFSSEEVNNDLHCENQTREHLDNWNDKCMPPQSTARPDSDQTFVSPNSHYFDESTPQYEDDHSDEAGHEFDHITSSDSSSPPSPRFEYRRFSFQSEGLSRMPSRDRRRSRGVAVNARVK